MTLPLDKAAAISKWPRYGAAEKDAIAALLDNNSWYGEIPAFEKEMKAYLQAPYVKSHMNATSALMSMFFALQFEPGTEILAPSYTAWATDSSDAPVSVRAGVRRYSSAIHDIRSGGR